MTVPTTKTCSICKKDKPIKKYTRRWDISGIAYVSACNDCRTVKFRDWRNNNRDKHREQCRKKNRKIRFWILNEYGGKCTCCGDTTFEFLAIDHIEGGGSQERKQLKRVGVGFFQWVRSQFLKTGKIPTGYRVLCHNCNMARAHYGYCPHEQKGVTLTPVTYSPRIGPRKGQTAYWTKKKGKADT